MGGGMGDWEACRYGIEGSLAGDICLNCFCQPCSMCQIAHTVGARPDGCTMITIVPAPYGAQLHSFLLLFFLTACLVLRRRTVW